MANRITTIGTVRCDAKSKAGGRSNRWTATVVIGNTSGAAAQEGQMGQAAYLQSKCRTAGFLLPTARYPTSEAICTNTIMLGIFSTFTIPFLERLGVPSDYAALALVIFENGYSTGEDVLLAGVNRLAPR